jgi:sec-independent protein translocase protein TatA
MELIVVLVIALIVLGPKRLPQAGRSIGRGMRELKDALAGDSKTDDDDLAVLDRGVDAGAATAESR